MFDFLRPKAEAKAPETLRRIPRKQLVAIMSGAKAAMGELTQLAKRAKSQRDDHAIVQDELLELLRTLASTQKQIDAQMNSDIAKSTDISDTEWDRPSYNLFVVPISQMANAPRVIVDSTLAASNNGVRDVKLLFDLVLAEMDVAIARFNVTLNSGLPDPWQVEAQSSNATSLAVGL
jgi:hypothetical protein